MLARLCSLPVAVLALAALATPALAAGPAPRPLTLATPGTELRNVTPWLISDDGSRLFFRTDQQLEAGDTDAAFDVYERSGDSTRLVSPGSAELAATLELLSADGTRAFFSTRESLLAEDTDTTTDLYERRDDGTLRLISRGETEAFDFAASADGRLVAFGTESALLPADTDAVTDLYAVDDAGTLRLLSGGSAEEHAGLPVFSADGTRFFFITDESLLPADTDTARDLYERRADGTLRLISTGGTSDDIEDFRVSGDGSRIYFETPEAIPGTGDVDGGIDVYERTATGLRLVTMGDSGSFAAEQILHLSRDGSRIIFRTYRTASPDDTDGGRDVYQRTDTGLRLISAGNASGDAAFVGASDDGLIAYFRVDEALSGSGDTDTAADVYQRRADDTLALVSGGSQNRAADGHAVTADGQRVFFSTDEAIDPGDDDNAIDLYEGTAAAAPRLLSTGADATAAPVSWFAAARDGSRVFFTTTEAILGTGDHDIFRDVYERRWSAPTVAVPTIAGGPAQPGSTLSCSADVTADGASVTRAWTRDGQAIAGADGATYTAGPADVGAQLRCRVTATNVMGAAAAESAPLLGEAAPVAPAPEVPAPAPAPGPAPPAPLADTTGPSVTLLDATCPRRARSASACKRYRSTLTAWRTLRFTATDASGLRDVRVGVVRTQGKRCFARRGSRFVALSCTKAAATTAVVKPGSTGDYRVKLSSLRPGRHTVRIIATDAAGQTTTFTRTLTLRR